MVRRALVWVLGWVRLTDQGGFLFFGRWVPFWGMSYYSDVSADAL